MTLFGQPNVERLKRTGNIPGLIKALAYQGRDASEVRKAAVEALGALQTPRTVEPLLQALEDPEGEIRIQAARALRTRGDVRTLEPFIKALRDPLSAVQEQAALALECLNDLRAVPPLLDALQMNVPQGESRPADRAIAHAIITLAHNQAQPLIALLRNKKRVGWEEATVALGKLSDQRAVAPLVEVALDNEALWSVRRTALTVLETLGWHPTEERHHLLQAVAARQWDVVETFGESSIELLLATLRVKDEPEAQIQAIALLVRFRTARAVGPLADLAAETEHLSSQRFSPQEERAAQVGSTQHAALQQAAIRAIEVLLERVAAEVPTEGLRKVGLLHDELSVLPQRTPQEREAATRLLFGPESVPMPRIRVKNLAYFELQRRGLKP